MKSMEEKLILKVSVEEANLIFKALGHLPFSQVYELIGKLNEQANQQLKEGSPSSLNPNISK